jgi:hypothetical protein
MVAPLCQGPPLRCFWHSVFCQSKGKIINPQSAGWTRFLDFANRNPEGHIHIIGLRGVRGGFM